MKKLITALGLLAVLATPVLAKATPERHDARPAQQQSAATIPWDAVVVDGHVVGQDPDPGVRAELRKDAYVSQY